MRVEIHICSYQYGLTLYYQLLIHFIALKIIIPLICVEFIEIRRLNDNLIRTKIYAFILLPLWYTIGFIIILKPFEAELKQLFSTELFRN